MARADGGEVGLPAGPGEGRPASVEDGAVAAAFLHVDETDRARAARHAPNARHVHLLFDEFLQDGRSRGIVPEQAEQVAPCPQPGTCDQGGGHQTAALYLIVRHQRRVAPVRTGGAEDMVQAADARAGYPHLSVSHPARPSRGFLRYCPGSSANGGSGVQVPGMVCPLVNTWNPR